MPSRQDVGFVYPQIQGTRQSSKDATVKALTIWFRFCCDIPLPLPPDVVGAGAEGAVAEPVGTPFVVGVVEDPLGPLVAFPGACMGADCPDMATVRSCN